MLAIKSQVQMFFNIAVQYVRRLASQVKTSCKIKPT